MNFRLSHNSVRVRVRKPDLDVLRQEGSVTESIFLPTGGAFAVSIEIGGQQEWSVLADNGRFCISLPAADALAWTENEAVALETSLPLPDGALLRLLVEKDFPCQHKPTDNPEETFHELSPGKE
jgi:hypothetical protein